MLNIWLFRISSVLLLFNAFLVSTKLPNGLFSAKELGLWFASGIICVFAISKILFTKNYKLQIKKLDVIICSYLILLPLLSLCFTKIAINYSAILSQIALGFSYVSIRILCVNIRTVVLVNMLIELIVLLLCFQLVIAVAQHFLLIPSYYPKFGATGMFFNPGPFAIFITALTVFIFPVFLHQVINKKYLNAAFYAILMMISTYFIINSLSRSAWLGGLAGLFIGGIMFLLVKFKWKISKKPIWLILIICLLIALPFCFWLYQYKADSATGRILTWKVTALMIKDHWPTGVGIGNFPANYIGYQANFFHKSVKNIQNLGNLAGDNRYPFNDILHIFAESGIIGIVLFIALFFTCTQIIIKSYQQQKKDIVLLALNTAASLVAIFVAGLTSYPFSMLPIAILFWLLIAILVSATTRKLIPKNNGNALQKFVLVSALFIASSIFLYNGFNKLYAYKKWMNIISTTNKDEKLDDLLLLAKPLNNNSDYLNDIAQIYKNRKQYNKAIVYLKRANSFSPYKGYYYSLGDCYERIGEYEKAIMQYKKVGGAIPNLIKPKYLLAKLHYNRKDYVTFKKLAIETIQFKPKINSEEVSEMKQNLYDMLDKLQLNP
ncbi:O-antigen ligase family protein [Pedobacter hiemivivus]|uniref:O-antigen ligase-related domain-containing protein n=1 Tax=Pedobacter hiemivivus TaxID=2530454 RepID=A0A4R0N944_9SPHI|nr:O-antigen ligase family protein [Pedobacter hiemivivus]TCC96565.1 hypothetical protein EZ444_11355 [Pedobacter hiemivivus]